jgi:hypothetical protein
MFGARSGWRKLMPESTTATFTAAEPVVRCHAASASMSAPAAPVAPPTVWPVLCSDHCSPKNASSGALPAVLRAFGSAHSTRGSRASARAASSTAAPGGSRTTTVRGSGSARSTAAARSRSAAARCGARTPGRNFTISSPGA